jgi:uncharacterized damage-inducible protein DinB
MAADGEALRKSLGELLRGGQAHATCEAALAGVDPEMRGERPGEGIPSVYEELTHMRIAQEDILRYTLDPSWTSPEWPAGYWPDDRDSLTVERWEKEVSRFFAGLEEVIALAEDPSVELTAAIPHGEGRTYLRQILLVADHNAYHTGQIVQARKLLGAWKR